ncbi:MAG: 50S ribosomal protein L11 methyltransferase [Solirubrobacteraceae bacterium]|nr:50S ribosomal protein L11 methyltransferase [Solirubrobacteraceae bacterium]
MIRLAVRVPRESCELVLAELLELAPSGIEEQDVPENPSLIEYAVYGSAGELPDLGAAAAHVAGIPVDVFTQEIADDWHERWRDFHKPVTIAGKLHVRPPWLEAQPGVLDLVIDPARAFGTGAHETTQLCLELLLELEPQGAMLDLGCGSGVLAIAAAQLGFSPVVGLDFDPASVEATDDNAKVNGVQVKAARFDLMHAEAIPSAPTVAANLLRPLLLQVAETGFAPEVPQTLVASGLLRHEADEVAAAFERHGLRETGRRELGDWAALLLQR